MLKSVKQFLVTGYLLAHSLIAFGGNTDPLFINLTSDDPHRVTMALNFGKHHATSGHPLTVFLSDKGVYLGVKSDESKYIEQQKMLSDLVTAGSLVIMCPLCLKHFRFTEADLLSGIQMGGAKVTGEALFRANTKTLSW